MTEEVKRFIELTIYFTENTGRFLTKKEQDFLKWVVLQEKVKKCS